MSFLKHHLSLIIPLVAFMFAYEFFIISDRIVEKYQVSLNSSYSIIIASELPLNQSEIEERIYLLDILEEIDAGEVLDRLKDEISSANLALLRLQLPKFYRMTLKKYPDEKTLEELKKEIEEITGVKRVETFAKTHNKVYRLLNYNKSVSTIFALLIFLMSFLMMIKQIEVWKFEHLERMEIMTMFGATYKMRSAILYRLAFIDSIIATAITAYSYYFLKNSEYIASLTLAIGVDEIPFYLFGDTLVLLGMSIAISTVSVFMVTMNQRRAF